MEDYPAFFARLTAGSAPHDWQRDLASDERCRDRLIRVPTGFGKTAGTVLAWLWHRVVRNDEGWPRRLVFCLPMRVLVEQTEHAVRGWLRRLGLERAGGDDPRGKVGLHLLMGGCDAGDWHLYPEACAVLAGTQDMLLSRALNRGFACPRARWPMDFGLLHHDVLWVMDEVQLMDVGLATSAQIQAFRAAEVSKGLRPSHTWWMSATLQRDWLRSADTAPMLDQAPVLAIDPARRTGPLWEDVAKPCRVVPPASDAEQVSAVVEAWRIDGRGHLTLVVLNTVERACGFYVALERTLRGELPGEGLHLVHSRFRPAERTLWREAFLRRDAPLPAAGRIIVATQVVEAGVDLDARLLVTDLAPWPSLVQRFGRAARGGGRSTILVLDREPKDDRAAAPYSKGEMDAAREALGLLDDVSPSALERFEEEHPHLLPRLYPYAPAHLLLRHEVQELFDTTPDLTGADVDISRYIRSGDERDVHVFWAELAPDADPPSALQPGREALCGVPFLAAREWLCGPGKAERLRSGVRAWVWDWLEGAWAGCARSSVIPAASWSMPAVAATTRSAGGIRRPGARCLRSPPRPSPPMRPRTPRMTPRP
ncbi:MAG: DEAD/DEAH box helicase [Planctomycetes bacterium]|nr:DEAD/DEAH box helicase [Planctomycetota bacterium]